MKRQLLATLIAATLGCGIANAQTTNNVESSTTPAPTVLTQEGKDAKVHSKAEYKARKKVAEANKELNKAECETSANGMAEHACKKEARASAKADKAHAQKIHEDEKKAIKETQKQ
jgi:hypothetical protein